MLLLIEGDRVKNIMVVCALAAVACNDGQRGPESIAVSHASALGIASIELDRSEGVFELHGLDANQREVAGVTLRIGKIAELPTYLPGDDTFGSEIVPITPAMRRRHT